MLFKHHRAWKYIEENERRRDPGFKYLPIREVLFKKLLLINLVQKMKNGEEIKETYIQRNLSTYFRRFPLCRLSSPSTLGSICQAWWLSWPSQLHTLLMHGTEKGHNRAKSVHYYRSRSKALPTSHSPKQEQKKWEGDRRSSGPGGRRRATISFSAKLTPVFSRWLNH